MVQTGERRGARYALPPMTQLPLDLGRRGLRVPARKKKDGTSAVLLARTRETGQREEATR
ncbi:MAG: hypothetical protein HY900_13405 [Deltaproteobacteria bacterium]|nr:hypothetical protein [Deltaproteobacteria bacterium]